MGKRKKRMTMKKYARKYAKKRAALFGARSAPEPTVSVLEEPTVQREESEPEPIIEPEEAVFQISEPIQKVEEQSVECVLPEEKAPEPVVNAFKETTNKNRKRGSKSNTTNKTTAETKTRTTRRRRTKASS
jgi:hypothetical protein